MEGNLELEIIYRVISIAVDPAPHTSCTINWTGLTIKQADDSWDEGYTITQDTIKPVQALDLICCITAEEYQSYSNRGSQRPIRIGLLKPRIFSRILSKDD